MEATNWIESVLESVTTAKVVGPSPDLFQKIQLKIQQEKVSLNWLLPTAAAVLILIGINLFFVSQFKNKITGPSEKPEITYLSTSNQLYTYVQD
jgi:hypothetical protein